MDYYYTLPGSGMIFLRNFSPLVDKSIGIKKFITITISHVDTWTTSFYRPISTLTHVR